MIWLWIAAGVVIFDIVLFGSLWLLDRWRYHTADRQLGAFETSRAIPDADNAAGLYKDICQRWPDLPSSPPGVTDDAAMLVRSQPWPGSDYPKLADWLNEERPLIAQLHKATQIQTCWVHIWDDLAKAAGWSLYGNALSWMTVLLWSANNDVGDGRTGSAIENWQCLTGLARHLYQQPSLCHRIFGLLVESEVFRSIAPFLVNDCACSDDRLTAIDSILLPAKDTWDRDAAQITRIEELCGQKRAGYMPFVDRVKQRIRPDPSSAPPGLKKHLEYVGRLSLRRLAQRRGMSTLIALRRHKNKTGRWPETLDEIRPSLPDEMFIDPRSRGPFAYALTDQGFTLTAVSPETTPQEHGPRDAIDGDWHIWPVDRLSTAPDETGNMDIIAP